MRTNDVVRLAFWNTFLLKPRPIPGGPGLPAFGELAAPAVAERASRIGTALSGRFDVVALCEAFEAPDRRRILDAWQANELETAVGPARSLLRGPLGFASSGLFSIVDGYPITRRSMHRYRTRGSYLHDADALANKGVLLIEIDLGALGRLEVFSTHLLYGTGLLGGSFATDPRRRHELRMKQLNELIDFVGREHRPGNTVAVVGDMNVPAHAPGYPDGADAQYRDLTERLAHIGVHDVWADLGSGDGPTCGAPTDSFADQQDLDDPDALIDGQSLGEPRYPVASADLENRERIDYVFLGSPDREPPALQATSIKRYAFVRPVGAPARDRLVRLSDHLAVGVELRAASDSG